MVTEQNSIAERTSGETADSSEACPSAHERNLPDMLRYLLVVFCVMALMYVAPFVLVRSTVYDSVNQSFFARPLNYAFSTAGQNADVVIFGDSTALFGTNPSQMSSDLGVKALNLVNTQGSLLVNDDMTLRRYLASNHPPKLIVFYFAPWDFDYGHIDFNLRLTYEGQELLLRQGTRSELLAFVKKHPTDAIAFPLKFYATGWEHILHHVSHASQDGQLAATHGHVDSTDLHPLESSCWFTPLLLDNIRFDWVRSLGQRYASPQTKVLFYVAPVPSCANVSSVINQPYEQLPAAPPKQVPPGFFSSDVRYLHPLPFAVPELTHDLADAVRPMLATPEAQPQPSPANAERRPR